MEIVSSTLKIKPKVLKQQESWMCFGHKGRKARALGLNVGVFKDHCSPFFLEIVSHSARKGKKKLKKRISLS